MKWRPFTKRVASAQDLTTGTDPDRLMRIMMRRDCSRETFRLLYAKLIELRRPEIKLTAIEPFALHFRCEDGFDYTIALENMFLQSRDHIDGTEIIERYLANVEEIGKPILWQRDQIVPQIKDHEFVTLLGENPHERFPLDHLVGDLWITYWTDIDNGLTTFSLSELAKVNVGREELLRLAMANLKRKLPVIERHGEGPWFLVTAGGDHTASLLLLSDTCDELAKHVDGDLVAVVPTRDVLLITGSASAEGLNAIRERGAELVATGDHIISATLLRRVGGLWKVYD